MLLQRSCKPGAKPPEPCRPERDAPVTPCVDRLSDRLGLSGPRGAAAAVLTQGITPLPATNRRRARSADFSRSGQK